MPRWLRRRSVGPLLWNTLLCGPEAWLLASCTCQKLMPPLFPDVSQDLRPVLRCCFPNVADFAKKHLTSPIGRHTSTKDGVHMQWSSGSWLACTCGCFLTMWLCSVAKNPKNQIEKTASGRKKKTQNSSMKPQQCRSRLSLQSSSIGLIARRVHGA